MRLHPSRITVRLLRAALPCLALAACSGDVTPPTTRPQATLSLTVAGRTTQWRADDAGYYVYNVGPTPETRAMYLTIARKNSADSSGYLEAFRFLPANQETPLVGSLSLTDCCVLGKPSYSLEAGFRFAPFMANVPPDSTPAPRLTIDSLVGEFAYGSLVVQFASSSAPNVPLTVRGNFIASRRKTWESMPAR